MQMTLIKPFTKGLWNPLVQGGNLKHPHTYKSIKCANFDRKLNFFAVGGKFYLENVPPTYLEKVKKIKIVTKVIFYGSRNEKLLAF